MTASARRGAPSPVYAAVLLFSAVATAALTYFVGRFVFGGKAWIALALPLIFLPLIAIEAALVFLRPAHKSAARMTFEDAWSSVSAGMTEQVVSSAITQPLKNFALPLLTYGVVRKLFPLWEPPTDVWWPYVLCLVAKDFEYYWAHRLMHTNAFLWIGHQVHHSSDHYNLTTALRQSWWQQATHVLELTLAPFFPLKMLVPCAAFNTLYQFWIHTCVIHRLGPLELILNTPSAHRMHHDRRLHKNFAAVFIIWDRMFGTFMDERQLDPSLPETLGAPDGETPQAFGIMRSPDAYLESPLQYTGFQTFLASCRRGYRAQGLLGLAKAVYRGPGYLTAVQHRNIGPPSASVVRQRLTARPNALARAYVVTHWLLSTVVGVQIVLEPSSPLALPRAAVVLLGACAQALVLDRSWRASRVMALHALAALTLTLVGERPGPQQLPLALAYGSSLVLAIFFTDSLELPPATRGAPAAPVAVRKGLKAA